MVDLDFGEVQIQLGSRVHEAINAVEWITRPDICLNMRHCVISGARNLLDRWLFKLFGTNLHITFMYLGKHGGQDFGGFG